MKVSWRKVLGTMLSVVFLSVAAPGQQQEGQEPAPLALVGTWKFNMAKSKYNSGPLPKLINLHYWWWDGDTLRHKVERLNGKGEVEMVAGHWSARYDSKDHLYGEQGGVTVSMTRFDEYTTEMKETFPGGRPASTFRQVVSKDRKTLTITRTNEGSSIEDVMVHDRQ